MPAQNSPGPTRGTQLDYVQRTTRQDISNTSAAAADTVLDGTEIVVDGDTTIKIECSGPFATSSQFISMDIWDGSTDLGVFFQSNGIGGGFYFAVFLTPSAGRHTYHLKAWRGTTSAALETGAGGAGTRTATWMRISVA